MCRHLAWIGPPRTLSSLLHDPPHSLERQSHAPRHSTHTTVSADGVGVAWWVPDRAEPARYRSTSPIWADRNLASLGEVVSASAILAATRSATPPLPVDESGTAPFLDGAWAGSLNGFVPGFRGPAGESLRAALPPGRRARLEAVHDGEVLVALATEAMAAGEPPADAVARAVRAARGASPDATAPCNLLLADGTTVVASAAGNSLFVLVDAGTAAGGVLVASEPLDDHPAWTAVPDGSVVVAEGGTVTTTALAEVPPT